MNRNGVSNLGTKRDGDGPLEELSVSLSLPPSLPLSLLSRFVPPSCLDEIESSLYIGHSGV